MSVSAKQGGDIVFLDTNVLVYLTSNDPSKARVSRSIFSDDARLPHVSTQVLGEFANVARKKVKLEWNEIEEFFAYFRGACHVNAITDTIQNRAIDLARRHKFNWYDAQIIASAQSAGARLLLSEDLQDGFVAGTLTIVNPFRV